MDVREAIGKTPKNDEAVAEAGKIYDSVFLPGLEKQKNDTLAWIKDGNLKQPTLLVWGKNDPSAVLTGGLERSTSCPARPRRRRCASSIRPATTPTANIPRVSSGW